MQTAQDRADIRQMDVFRTTQAKSHRDIHRYQPVHDEPDADIENIEVVDEKDEEQKTENLPVQRQRARWLMFAILAIVGSLAVALLFSGRRGTFLQWTRPGFVPYST